MPSGGVHPISYVGKPTFSFDSRGSYGKPMVTGWSQK